MRFWACWKAEPRDPQRLPCGYDENSKDERCLGCADDPRTRRMKELDAAVEKTAKSWAYRWGK